MSNKGLKIVLPSSVTDTSMRKLEHYYGIEFTRGVSNNGGDNGYHAMIGDESLLKEMRFHNQMKIASVKDAAISTVLNQTNWRKTEDGGASVLNGSDDADIMQTREKGVYAILGGTNETYERYIISDEPFSYDGDVAQYYPASGESPDYVTLKDGKLRSIRNDSVVGTQLAGSGTNYSDSQYGTTDGGGYPKTQLTRFQYEQYARAKNDEADTNLPYIISCHQDIELTQAMMFIEFRTKNLNACLGHGISAVAAPTESTWGKVSGIRLTADNGATYVYGTFGTNFYTGEGNTTATTLWTIFNSYSPLLKMFEAQLAVSDGATLESVKDADGNAVQGMDDGVMTGIWTKTLSFQFTAAQTSGGEVKTWKADVVMRVPIWRGRTRLWGHLYQWYSGYEILRYFDGESCIHKVYRAKSIADIMTDTDADVKTAEGQYGFESKYEYIGDLPKTTGTTGTFLWGKNTLKTGDGIPTPFVSESGASRETFENAGVYMLTVNVAGQYQRLGSFFGGGAAGGGAVLRFAVVNSAPSDSSARIGSGLRVQLSA